MQHYANSTCCFQAIEASVMTHHRQTAVIPHAISTSISFINLSIATAAITHMIMTTCICYGSKNKNKGKVCCRQQLSHSSNAFNALIAIVSSTRVDFVSSAVYKIGCSNSNVTSMCKHRPFSVRPHLPYGLIVLIRLVIACNMAL